MFSKLSLLIQGLLVLVVLISSTGEARKLVEVATKQNNANSASFDCFIPGLPCPFPGIPLIPGVPSIPGWPWTPGTPSTPSIPGWPWTPSTPSTPNPFSPPGWPWTPSTPSTPNPLSPPYLPPISPKGSLSSSLE
ncbi:hypothetical protein P8452_51080 [Trifolium repens]|nr:hypothetical protein P8452_51080 [Trifolium repens]